MIMLARRPFRLSGRRASVAPGAVTHRRQSVAPWLLQDKSGALPTLESSLKGAVLGGIDQGGGRRPSMWGAGAAADERVIIPSQIFERQRLEVRWLWWTPMPTSFELRSHSMVLLPGPAGRAVWRPFIELLPSAARHIDCHRQVKTKQ